RVAPPPAPATRPPNPSPSHPTPSHPPQPPAPSHPSRVSRSPAGLCGRPQAPGDTLVPRTERVFWGEGPRAPSIEGKGPRTPPDDRPADAAVKHEASGFRRITSQPQRCDIVAVITATM